MKNETMKEQKENAIAYSSDRRVEKVKISSQNLCHPWAFAQAVSCLEPSFLSTTHRSRGIRGMEGDRFDPMGRKSPLRGITDLFEKCESSGFFPNKKVPSHTLLNISQIP